MRLREALPAGPRTSCAGPHTTHPGAATFAFCVQQAYNHAIVRPPALCTRPPFECGFKIECFLKSDFSLSCTADYPTDKVALGAKASIPLVMSDLSAANPGKSSTKFFVLMLSGASAALKKGAANPSAATLTLTTLTVASYSAPPYAPQRQAPLSSLPLGDCLIKGNASCPLAGQGALNLTQAVLDNLLVTFAPAFNGKTLWAVTPVGDATGKASVLRYHVISIKGKTPTLASEGTITPPNGVRVLSV
jgi:hypothetical protein